MDIIERFKSHVSVNEQGCWLWTGYVWSNGYACFAEDGKTCRAHRWSYRTFVGPVDRHQPIDHLCHPTDGSCTAGDSCEHRRCVNPNHLGITTPRENTLRGNTVTSENAAKSHCKWGHPLSGANLYTTPDGKRRKCVACKLRRTAEWRAKNPTWRSDFYARTGH